MTTISPLTTEPTEPAEDADPADPIDQMREMLLEQSLTLDAIFTDMAEQAAQKFVEWPGLSQSYLRLALRAQSACRASLATMAAADRAVRRAGEDGAA